MDRKQVALFSGAAIGLAAATSFFSYRVAENRTSERDRRYQELTLKFSEDLSALDRGCSQRRTDTESGKRAVLRALSAAQGAVAKHDQEALDARLKRDKVIAEAQQQAVQKGHELDLAFRERTEEVERESRAADENARTVRDAAQRKAKEKLDAAQAIISRKPLEEQFPSRQEAQAVFEGEVAGAQAAYERTLKSDQGGRAAAQQKAQTAENDGNRRAKEQAQWAVAAAESAYQAELAAGEARFVSAVMIFPEAAAIATDFAKQRSDLDADCDKRDKQLRADFRKAKEALESGN